jgi:transcriptional regulator with XRE-family HTH domain
LTFLGFKLTASKPKSSDYPKELKTLGDHLRKRRLDLKLLQKEVGQRIGGSVSDVWNWENGNASPAVKFIPAIIAFLGYNPMPKPEALPEQLVWFRKGNGWTQKAFAKVLSVDQTTLARWERGERAPVGKFQALVASALARESG